MFGSPFTLESLLPTAIGLLVAVTLHEYAHARAADALGDRTARMQGRLTLNPIAHLDPIGLIMLLFYGFGWARPVPVNPYAFSDPRRGMMLVAAAGPLTNVVIALVALVVLLAIPVSGLAWDTLRLTYLYNIWLAAFNVIPVPPLDGSKILGGLLPPAQAAKLWTIEQYGWLILILLLVTGTIRIVLNPLIQALHWLVGGLAGIVTGTVF